MLTYTIVLTPEPNSSAVTVTVPAMPGIVTWGSTTEEAIVSAREAIALHLESYIERGQPFPTDPRFPGGHTHTIRVRPPAGAKRRIA